MATPANELPDSKAQDRRLIIRLADYWEEVRGEMPYARLSNFDMKAVGGMRAHSFLIGLNPDDFHASPFLYVGDSITEDCGINLINQPVSNVPRGTLLSRLTDHFLEVLANKCPMGFEAEFRHQKDTEILYRGIMLPLSDSGETVDYILGAINCRHRPIQENDDEAEEVSVSAAKADQRAASPAEADISQERREETNVEEIRTATASRAAEGVSEAPAMPAGKSASDVAANDWDLTWQIPRETAVERSVEAALFERLGACRSTAYAVQEAEAKAQSALHETLRKVFAFAWAAEAAPEAYHRVLEEHGITPMPQQPYLDVLQLVFGPSYDRERLSLYAAALNYARRNNQTADTLIAFIEGHPGGIRGCARAEPLPVIGH